MKLEKRAANAFVRAEARQRIISAMAAKRRLELEAVQRLVESLVEKAFADARAKDPDEGKVRSRPDVRKALNRRLWKETDRDLAQVLDDTKLHNETKLV